MNKTNVPTEWLEELQELNEEFQDVARDDIETFNLMLGKIEAHIKASKYFNQPEQSSELEEFAAFLRRYKYDAVLDRYERINSFGTFFTFSEVLQAFQNREK